MDFDAALYVHVQGYRGSKIGRCLKITQTDLFSDQIAGFGYALCGIQKDKAMAKASMEKNRDGDKRQSLYFAIK